jgi:7-cyano-7-deazaguanine synthase
VDFGQAAAPFERRAGEAIAHHVGASYRSILVRQNDTYGSGEILGRNMFLTSAALLFGGLSTGVIALGIHAGTTYYDCSRDFLNEIDGLISAQSDGRIRVLAPFIDWTKKDVFDYFSKAELPLELTYSCEAGTQPVCGECNSCLDRTLLQSSRSGAQSK